MRLDAITSHLSLSFCDLDVMEAHVDTEITMASQLSLYPASMSQLPSSAESTPAPATVAVAQQACVTLASLSFPERLVAVGTPRTVCARGRCGCNSSLGRRDYQ
eukprot:6174261-Pleurochrysis_carterae.AAC.2